MSSFMKKGKRKDIINKVNQHKREIFTILAELDDVAKEIYKNHPEITDTDIKDFDENVLDDIAPQYTDRKIENFEKFILAGKLFQLKDLDED